MMSAYKLCNTFNTRVCGAGISQAIVTACITAFPVTFSVVSNIPVYHTI
jgi:hypothetical protein